MGRKLLQDIKKVHSLTWTNNGSVIYRGKALPGSDIAKLVNDVVGGTERKQSKLFTHNKPVLEITQTSNKW